MTVFLLFLCTINAVWSIIRDKFTRLHIRKAGKNDEEQGDKRGSVRASEKI